MDIFGIKRARKQVLKMVFSNKSKWYGYRGSLLERIVISKLVKQGYIKVTSNNQFAFNHQCRSVRKSSFKLKLNQF